jgi:hypothetical protein
MMRLSKIGGVLALGCCLFLSGCFDMRSLSGKVWPTNGQDSGVSQFLACCWETAAMPPAEQDVLFTQLRKEFEKEKNDRTRFELVCLAVQPKRSTQDLAWARELLRDYLAKKRPREDLAALGELLENMIGQRLQVEQRLAEERKRAETLAGKLKALEDIEKIIQKREEGASPP